MSRSPGRIVGRGLWPVDVLREHLDQLRRLLDTLALDYPITGWLVLADLRGRWAVVEYGLRCHGPADDMPKPLRVFLGEVLVDTTKLARWAKRDLRRDQRAKQVKL